jgi:plasmid stabilization system protein ParE
MADLEGILRWQTQPGAGAAAIRRLSAIRAAIRRLQRTPCVYPVGDQPGVREMPCVGHRVVYKVDPDTGSSRTAGDVTVLRVYGAAQARDP